MRGSFNTLNDSYPRVYMYISFSLVFSLHVSVPCVAITIRRSYSSRHAPEVLSFLAMCRCYIYMYVYDAAAAVQNPVWSNEAFAHRGDGHVRLLWAPSFLRHFFFFFCLLVWLKGPLWTLPHNDNLPSLVFTCMKYSIQKLVVADLKSARATWIINF